MSRITHAEHRIRSPLDDDSVGRLLERELHRPGDHRDEDDGELTCRMVWGCADRQVWWHWVDRPEGPLEPCPYPGLLDY
ncbi:hypothetical protein [Streptomyces sp. NPDC097640]|uniref:hypothetical protein n=1 Tax=Streptomyces sp. NPDC097640 TaxID=3157229 RepID=UPI0033286E24